MALKAKLAYTVLIFIGLLLNWQLVKANRTGWGVDFNQFYAASHLAGTGKLYDWDALQREEQKHGVPVHTARLPVVAFGVKAVSWLPYPAAHAVWFMASVAALLGAALIWPQAHRPPILAALACSGPAALLLLLGQDTPFWLLFFAAGFALLQRGRPTLAGIIFAFCLCKYHLALAIPFVLAARQCWKALLAGALATLFLFISCFFIEGPRWPLQYLTVFAHADFSPAADRMPNLRGLASWTAAPNFVQAALVLFFTVLLMAAMRNKRDWGSTACFAAAVGLLLAPHGYANDLVLLLPLGELALRDKSAGVRLGGILLMSPLPLLLLGSNQPLWGQILIMTLVAALLSRSLLVTRPDT